MKARYGSAKVYVDHHSNLSFVYMQKDQSSAKHMRFNTAFENCAKSHGVQVENYECQQ